MMNNYKAYTPELNEWQLKGLGFFPGSESVSGTGWTIAGITAALCGLPLNMPMGIGEYHGSLPTYLPNAVCLMDILHEQGYNQMFVQGTSAEFTQKRKFWTTHGLVEVHDELHYKKQGKVPEDYHVFWGIEDEKTLSYAREDLDSLSKRNSPFAFYLLTVDTHQPNGYVDESCNYSEDTPFKNALRCTSNKVGKLLAWMSEQPWFENTIVLVVGDHTQQMLSEKAGLPKDEKLYAMSFLLNVSTDGISFNRGFSNLDYTPTLLEALGWRIPDHGFALGRSLISNEPTMLEMFGRDSLDVLLRQRSIQYNYFLYGK